MKAYFSSSVSDFMAFFPEQYRGVVFAGLADGVVTVRRQHLSQLFLRAARAVSEFWDAGSRRVILFPPADGRLVGDGLSGIRGVLDPDPVLVLGEDRYVCQC